MSNAPVNYRNSLDQGLYWPRYEGSEFQNVAIDEMVPQHALSALRKLVQWASESSSRTLPLETARSPLAYALLRQALGAEPALFIPNKMVALAKPVYVAGDIATVLLDIRGSAQAKIIVRESIEIAEQLCSMYDVVEKEGSDG